MVRMRARLRVVTLVVVWPLACAQILDLDTYDGTVANGSGGQDGGSAGAPANVQSSTASGGAGGTSCLDCGDALPAEGGTCPSECFDGVKCTCVNNTFSLMCGPMNNCSAQKKTCPDGFNCEVFCDSPYCNGTTIECPRDHWCIVHCVGSDACISGVEVKCTNAPCQVSCENSIYACADISMTCGCNDCTAVCDGTLPWSENPTAPKPHFACGEGGCRCESCFGVPG